MGAVGQPFFLGFRLSLDIKHYAASGLILVIWVDQHKPYPLERLVKGERLAADPVLPTSRNSRVTIQQPISVLWNGILPMPTV